ncbi:Aspartic proteinase nepenthesin-1 [Melia azedarach]|uniref:Aspartic proteinase nepenthesin-1 n=1 Tax=Melia azedarach TaxID=155640 RepID=A0ACC1Y7E9_MELAZ|nr:Aspartic proteinase nepenthesin-1 [Melia azedarach]
MVFYVGTPPRLVYASLDTGSDLLWFQCVPCKHCLSQYIHIFNPTKSLTFRKSACHSPECNTLGLDRSLCNSSNEPCNYLAVYGISVSTITAANGTLSIDKFKLEDTNRTAVEVGFLTFGCSDDLSQSYEGNPGIVGLESKIYFGSQVVMLGGQTPIVGSRAYYVSLLGISVGDRKVPIPPGTFDTTQDGGGFAIDSGTQLTTLRREAYDPLVQMLREAIDLPQWRRSSEDHPDLCFQGSIDDFALVPNITFHFNGTDVILSKETTYMQVGSNVSCLAMLGSTSSVVSLFGNLQQQNYYIGYDLEKEVISFAPVNCATF